MAMWGKVPAPRRRLPRQQKNTTARHASSMEAERRTCHAIKVAGEKTLHRYRDIG